MHFELNEKTQSYLMRLKSFMDSYVYPVEQEIDNFISKPENSWQHWSGFEELKNEAKEAGLWNLFLPSAYGDLSPGLTNLEYAPLAEEMGRVRWASEIFNCSPPDTGNMEVLAKYGSQEQKDKWLLPLMEGKIRSAFLMTEPDIASSDATNIQTSIRSVGDHYIINGKKWWSSGAMNPNCAVTIVMGKTDPNGPRHKQQSMIIVPMDTEGLEVIRPLSVFGYNDSPEGHAEISLSNVKVPKSNLILGEGSGFEIAQGRLGPGRIHHCMRLIGMAQRSLELMCKRVQERTVFGKELKDYSSIRQDIALSRCEIEQARLLVLSAADKMDRYGNKEAKDLIAMIKIVCPQMAIKVIDRAIQIYGGMGLSSDTPLAGFYSGARILRLADGPDEVHMYQLGKNTVRSFNA